MLNWNTLIYKQWNIYVYLLYKLYFEFPQEYPSKNDNVVIRIFAVLLHAHLLAKQVVLHHFRNGKELTNIASDRNYDFNYQEMVFLNKEVEILRVRFIFIFSVVRF